MERFSHANGGAVLKGEPGVVLGGGTCEQPAPLIQSHQFWGAHLGIGVGDGPPEPFPVPLPRFHAKIQEDNDVAKQGWGTAGAHWPGGAAVAPQTPPAPG